LRAPSSAPTSENFVDVLDALLPVYGNDDYSEEVLTNLESPQYKAAQWIVYATQKVLQRFALATSYSATNSDDWTKCSWPD
jgi:hypothetical protein